MRIALISDTYAPQVNGVTTVVRRIAATVRAADHAVAVVAPRYPDQSDEGGSDEPNLNGLLVPPHDASGFGDAIVALVLDAPRRRAMGRAARLTAEGRDVRTENQELLQQYSALTGTGIELNPCAA